MPVGEEDIIDTQQKKYNSDNSIQGEKDTSGSLIWSSKSQKTKTYIKETTECHQRDELSLCPRLWKDIHGGVGLTQMTKLKGQLIIPTLPMQRRGGKMTPICGINRGNHAQVAIWPQDTYHLHRNNYSKRKIVRSWKAFPDLKIYIGTLKLENATQKSGMKCSSLKPGQKISRLKKLQ